MKFSFNWLKELSGYRGNAPALGELLRQYAFEVKEVAPHGKDYVLDIDVLPNRAADCFSHAGIAREIAAITKKEMKFSTPAVVLSEGKGLRSSLYVHIDAPELCSRYVACVVEGVVIKESPKWLKEKLLSCGMAPINNIVDAVNYAMLLTGQPMHAFDFDRIADHEIAVRTAQKGETIATLSGEHIALDESMLIIADSGHPLAIAGIKGGKKAEIVSGTKRIVLEAAMFDAKTIRKTSKATGIRTDSSLRFEHGVSDWTLETGMAVALDTIRKTSGGALKNKYDAGRKEIPHQRKVSFSMEFLRSFIDEQVEEKEVFDILARLGIAVKKKNLQKLLLDKADSLLGRPYKKAASTMYDAPHTFDCSSLTRFLFREIGVELPRISVAQLDSARHIGFEALQPCDLVFRRGDEPHVTKKHPDGIGHVGLYVGRGKVIHASGIDYKGKVVKESVDVFLKNNWRGAGRIDDLTENAYLAFIPPFRKDIVVKEDLAEEIIRIKGYDMLISKMPHGTLAPAEPNDAVAAMARMRSMLSHFGFSEAYNYSFIGDEDKKRFMLADDAPVPVLNPISRETTYMRPTLAVSLLKNIRDNRRFFEEIKMFEIGNVFTFSGKEISEKRKAAGIFSRVPDASRQKHAAFFEMKGILEGILSGLGIDDVVFSERKGHDAPWDPMRFAAIMTGESILGSVGFVENGIREAYGLRDDVVLFEIDFASLLAVMQKEFEYRPIAKYPSVVRDLSLIVAADTKVVDVTNIIEHAGGHFLLDADLFDLYEDEQKSMTFRLVFQSEEKTLTDEEVNKAMSAIIAAAEEAGWEAKK